VLGPAPSRVGRDGLLRLAFARRGAATVLTERYFRTPLQVLEALSFPADPALGVVLLNPTGGVLGGDRLVTGLRLEEGAHVVVSTPSATRVYGTRLAAALQTSTVAVGPDATLEYVPDHVILHPHARLEQSVQVDLAPGARLLLWDAWALGRPARDEVWRFDGIVSAVRVTRAGAPVFVDRMRLEPPVDPLASMTGAAAHAYVASWLVCSDRALSWTALANELADAAASIPGVRAAGTALARDGLLVRLLSATAYALLDAQRCLWALTRARALGLPPLDLRKA
jgi:urease accessory protein